MLLLDTDMLVLLTASGNLEKVTEVLGYSSDQLRRLDASIHQVQKGANFRNTYGEAVLRQIAPKIEKIPEAPVPADIELLDKLYAVVDEGEALLMALAASMECTLLLTGDKNAIKNLAASEATDYINQLRGRIVTLEAILCMLIVESNAATVRDTFQPVLGYSTLRIVLSEHAVTDDRRCLDGIKHYFDDLSRDASGLLFNPVPGYLDSP